MNNIETLKRWLVALEDAASCVQKNYLPDQMGNDWDAEIEEMRQAIEQAQQAEPVAYIRVSKTGHVMACAKTENFFSLPHKTLLYTSPPPRQPLTSKQIREWWASENGFEDCNMARLDDFEQVVRAVEGKHGIKGEA